MLSERANKQCYSGLIHYNIAYPLTLEHCSVNSGVGGMV
jgi:hypothetical protein